MTFHSKIDLWVWLCPLVLGLGLIAALFGAVTASSPAALNTFLLTIVLVLLSLAFVAWIMFSTHYTVQSEALQVRSGPFQWQIPLSSIGQVRPTRNPLSAPALSLDRLEVSYGERKRILISPDNQNRFLTAINRPLASSSI